MRYPIVIHKDPESDYGVTVPDVPGCFSAGETMDEALSQAVEAIECHLEGLMMDSLAIPMPKSIEHHQDNPDYTGGVWALVSVDPSKLSSASQQVNITLPERLLRVVDDYAARYSKSRSGFMVQAALEFMASHP
jgi:predicted RNase H-like HicB family nuclease